MEIRIFQGTDEPYPPADINIVIDVIRAFTVSHIAFLRGVAEIKLVNSVEEAHALKLQSPALLLAGEIAGIPIETFDLDNSPHTFSTAEISGRTLVQKTSNGVKATLLALNARHVFVTGLSNARNTALHVRNLRNDFPGCRVNIIASHADDDDDLACAEYIRDILQETQQVSVENIKSRILASRPAQKFLDACRPEFDSRDLDYCTREIACNFVMEVDANTHPPRILQITAGNRQDSRCA
jgi:2-phosphosulfolactate phosphatase